MDPQTHALNVDGERFDYPFPFNKPVPMLSDHARRFAAIDCNGREPGPFLTKMDNGEVYIPVVIAQSDASGNSISLRPGQVIADINELETKALKARVGRMGIEPVPSKRADLLKVIQDGGFLADGEDDLIDGDDDEDDLGA